MIKWKINVPMYLQLGSSHLIVIQEVQHLLLGPNFGQILNMHKVPDELKSTADLRNIS